MTGRLMTLDGLRGGLALYILAAHTVPFLALPSAADWLGILLSHGHAAVELFFMLSGMVILRSVVGGAGRDAAPMGAAAFLLARAGRLLPVYAIALALGAAALSCGDPIRALPYLAGHVAARDIAEAAWPRLWLAHLAAHLTLTQGLFPPILLPYVEFTILGPAWSLSTEWQFYLVVAAILACRRNPASGPGRAGHADWPIFAAAAMAMGALGFLVGRLPVEWQPGRAFLPNEAWYFALGIVSYGLLLPGRARATWAWWLLCMAAAAFVQPEKRPILASAIPLLWAACLACEMPSLAPLTRQLAAVLTSAPLQWLGRISYPLYLIHLPIQRLGILALAPALGRYPAVFSLLWGPGGILAALLAAQGLHLWVELPCWRWSRRVARQRWRRPAGAEGLQGAA